MARQRRKFSPEFRQEAVRLVVEDARPMAHVARELGVGQTTLSKWVAAYRDDHGGDEPAPLATHERIRLAEAERELRELRLELEFLKKAAAYFAKDPR
jgi:transposase